MTLEGKGDDKTDDERRQIVTRLVREGEDNNNQM